MKKILLLFIAVFLFADVSNIIRTIKNMDYYKPKFHKFVNYNIFAEKQKKQQTVISNKSVPLILEAIFNNKAYINGRWVKTGDFINAYKVTDIRNNYVVLKKFNKTYVLKFKNNILKVKK